MCLRITDESSPPPRKWTKTGGVYEAYIEIGGFTATLFTYETRDEKGHAQFGVGISAPFTEREYLNIQYTPSNTTRPLIIDKDPGKIGFVLRHREDFASDELPSSLQRGVRDLLRALESSEVCQTERVN